MSGYYVCLFHGNSETLEALNNDEVSHCVIDTNTDLGDYAIICSTDDEIGLIALHIDYSIVEV